MGPAGIWYAEPWRVLAAIAGVRLPPTGWGQEPKLATKAMNLPDAERRGHEKS